MGCPKKKIVDTFQLKKLRHQWKADNLTVVLTNGCFDILHAGHISYLNESRLLGDRLIIALNSDHSIKSLKGSKRPIVSEMDRALILASLFFVDAVCIFDSETPYELIQTIQPDILTKGKDYNVEEIAGSNVVHGYGGVVRTLNIVQGYSTSKYIQNIVELYGK